MPMNREQWYSEPPYVDANGNEILYPKAFLYDCQKWLREVHNTHIEILNGITMSTKSKVLYDYTIKCNPDGYGWCKKITCGNITYSTYEQALDAAIKEACKMIINK